MIGTVLPFFYRRMSEDQHRFSLQGGRFSLRLHVQIVDPFHDSFCVDCDSNWVNTCDILGEAKRHPAGTSGSTGRYLRVYDGKTSATILRYIWFFRGQICESNKAVQRFLNS